MIGYPAADRRLWKPTFVANTLSRARCDRRERAARACVEQ